MCYKSHLSRGQEVKRPKDLKTFFKKVERTLDFVTSVIYVTRITTGATTDFVTVPACNWLQKKPSQRETALTEGRCERPSYRERSI